MNKITLIIPAKNEEESLIYVLKELKNIKCKKILIVTSIAIFSLFLKILTVLEKR